MNSWTVVPEVVKHRLRFPSTAAWARACHRSLSWILLASLAAGCHQDRRQASSLRAWCAHCYTPPPRNGSTMKQVIRRLPTTTVDK